VFACAVPFAMASDASLSELAPPGTKVAAGINVRGLLDSPLASEIGAQEREAVAKLAVSGKLTGLDPFKDVDRVWAFMTSANDKAPALLVVRGRFDVEQMARGAKRYKDVPVVEAGAEAGYVFGLIDGQTAIAGETAQVFAAIDRLGSGAHLDAEMQGRIDAAASRYDIWGTGDVPDGMPVAAAQAPGLGSIDRFMFGVTLRQGLGLTAEIHARSTEDAGKLMALLSTLEAAIKSQKKEGGPTFDAQSENGTFRISMTVPEAELREAIGSRRAAAMAALSQRLGAEAAGPATATVPAIMPPAVAPPAVAPLTIGPRPAIVTAPPAAPKLQPKPPAQGQIVKTPGGDTMILRLPGAK